MLGADVTFDKLNVSLLGGSVEAHGVTVSGADPAAPLLTIRRVRAEISLGAALKKEVIVKSLTIEKPVLTLVRGPDGKLNLPPTIASSDTSAIPRQTSDVLRDTAATGDDRTSWKLDAKKVLIVDAEVHYRDVTGYHASIEQLLAELKQSDTGFDFTIIADSVGRRDVAAPLGTLKLAGTATNVPSLLKWDQARVNASFELEETLHGRADVPSLKPINAKIELAGGVDLTLLRRILPVTLPIDIEGRVNLSARATYDRANGLRVPELSIKATDVSVPLSRKE